MQETNIHHNDQFVMILLKYVITSEPRNKGGENPRWVSYGWCILESDCFWRTFSPESLTSKIASKTIFFSLDESNCFDLMSTMKSTLKTTNWLIRNRLDSIIPRQSMSLHHISPVMSPSYPVGLLELYSSPKICIWSNKQGELHTPIAYCIIFHHITNYEARDWRKMKVLPLISLGLMSV